MRQAILAAMLLGITEIAFAQETKETNTLTISGYAEVYYLRDMNRPLNNTRPGFVYSHNRTDEVNLNLAFIKAHYRTEKTRASLALSAGTYMNANYGTEPGVLKNLYEANVGLKLSKKHNLWIDAGILPSHLGFESALGKDNWTLTRSLSADNSPYFETGAKISYTSSSGNWLISGLVLNGWQRIQRVDGNSTPAFGHQFTYQPTDKLTLNSGSFAGSDKPDSIRQVRFFHNLYAIYQLTEQLGVTAGFDIGAEQQEKGSKTYRTWYTPVLVAQYSPTTAFSLTVRGEYYWDRHGVIITTGTAAGFQTWGYSLNADYRITSQLVWRTEVRNLSSKDNLFIKRGGVTTRNNTTVVTALAIDF